MEAVADIHRCHTGLLSHSWLVSEDGLSHLMT